MFEELSRDVHVGVYFILILICNPVRHSSPLLALRSMAEADGAIENRDASPVPCHACNVDTKYT